MRKTVLLLTALLLAPLAHADDAQCKLALGRGWPPATENYGTATEKMFAGETQPTLSFTLLPKLGVESGVLLVADPNGGDWLLRRAVADERVHAWEGDRLVLRTTRAPEFTEAPIPAAIATRLVADWRRALSLAVPEGVTAPFSEGDTWLFVAGDLRVSGLRPDCELGALLRDQIDLLIEASDEGDGKREKRWRQIGESLDRMRVVLDAMAAPATTAATATP
ncbi:hypothetical protein GCM10027431_16090 [Lysobacter rhizosphaerae]